MSLELRKGMCRSLFVMAVRTFDLGQAGRLAACQAGTGRCRRAGRQAGLLLLMMKGSIMTCTRTKWHVLKAEVEPYTL